MDNSAKEILKKLLPGISFTNMPEEEEKHESRFPCMRCGGSGWIPVVQNGFTKMMRCPECAAKRDIARIVNESGINIEDYQRFRIENFQIKDDVTRVMKETALRFLKDKPKDKGVGFFGRSGTGKTHLSIAILMQMGTRHRYWKYRREIQKIKNAMYRNAEEYERLMQQATDAENLYIDDFLQGAIDDGKIDKQDLQIMFELIDTRYVNRKRTFFSSNSTLEMINAASEPLASRIYEMCAPYLVEIDPKDASNVRYLR